MSRSCTRCIALAGVAVLWAGSPAWAVVDTIDATVTAEVKQFVGQSAGDSDLAFEDLTETTGNLPLLVQVELFGDGDETGGLATTVFHDPRASQTGDPDEFGIEAGTFSRALETSYLSRSHATETREVTFLPGEIFQPEGTALSVRSHFFVDGILAVWGDQGQSDLTGTLAEVSLSVLQTRPGGDPVPVLTAGLSLTGQGQGSAAFSATGALSAANVIVLDLSAATDELGSMHVVVIPATTAIPYVYPADVGETFTLKAEIEGRARSQPGTGAAVELGVPVLELAALVGDVTGGEVGALLRSIIAEAVGSAPLATKPLSPPADATTVTVVEDAGNSLGGLGLAFCGNMGIESALLLTLFAAAAALASRGAVGRRLTPDPGARDATRHPPT